MEVLASSVTWTGIMCGTRCPVERAHLDRNYCTIFTRVEERLQCGMGSGKFWLMQVRTSRMLCDTSDDASVRVQVVFHQCRERGRQGPKQEMMLWSNWSEMQSIKKPIDWLTDWLIDWLIDWSIDRSIDRSIDQLFSWFINPTILPIIDESISWS